MKVHKFEIETVGYENSNGYYSAGQYPFPNALLQ